MSREEPIPPYINPADYGVDWSQEPVGIGESRAYRGQRDGTPKILKVFAFGLPESFIVKVSLAQLFKYDGIVNAVLPACTQIVSPYDTDNTKITFSTVPLRDIGVTTYGKRTDVPISVGDFIDGPTLDEDDDTRQLLERLARTRKVDVSTLDATHILLADVTRQLRTLTGERAVRLESYNIKSQKTDSGLYMVITDPVAELAHIK